MDTFRLSLPHFLTYGTDIIGELPDLVRRFGTRAMVISESVMHEGQHITRVKEILKRNGIEVMVYDELMPGSPSSRIDEIASLARASRTQVVIGVGGMRVLSSARCVANIAAEKGTIAGLLKGELPVEPLPYIEVPSSYRNHLMMRDEVIMRDPMDGRARIVRIAHGTVRAVLVDTAFTQTLSGKYALAAIIDTLLAAIEGFFSPARNAFSEPLLERAIADLTAAARIGIRNPADSRFRARAAAAGVMTAMGLASTGQGMGGALAYAINARMSLPKSWVATILLPHVMDALAGRDPEQAAATARALGEPVEGIIEAEDAPRAARALRRLLSHLDIPARLRDLDVTLEELSAVADEAAQLSLVTNVPGGAANADLRQLVSAAF